MSTVSSLTEIKDAYEKCYADIAGIIEFRHQRREVRKPWNTSSAEQSGPCVPDL